MMEQKGKSGWNPYLAGALVGVLAVLSVVVSTQLLEKPKYLGSSTTFVRVAGLIEQKIAPQHVADNAYFTKTKIKVDWQMMLVIGVFIGALVSSLTDRSFKTECVPPMWAERFGSSVPKRAVVAFIGGLIGIIGVRMASGCPSGHGLSGMMQLAASGLVGMIFFLAGGIITARVVYGGKS